MEYKLNVQPGKIVKETYNVKVERIVDSEAPNAGKVFTAPYVANVNLTLGTEIVDVWTSPNDGQLMVQDGRYKTTKTHRILRLGKVVGKIISSELKSVFNGTESCVKYTGIPAGLDDEIRTARGQLAELMDAYVIELKNKSKQKETLVSRQTINIIPDGSRVKVETLDDKL